MSDEARPKLVILGIGDDGLAGLTEAARRLLAGADVLLGAPSVLEQFDDAPGRKVVLEAEMPGALAQVREALKAQSPVLVCGGDPLFYGVARYLCDRLGKDSFTVVPHVSSMQLAFARVKESWEEAYLTSLAGRPIEAVVDRIRTAEKVGLFSGDDHTPSRLARALLDRGIDYFRAYVCENLGSPDERVTQAELSELIGMDFSPLNVLILVRKPNRPNQASRHGGRRLFGNPDDAFAQSLPSSGLITQAEVRAMALAQLDIRPSSTVWDVGAGSGSLAIEAAQLASLGMVYAIEPEPADFALIQANAEAFGVPNVKAVAGRAPEVLAGLPDPDAVFLGGLGRQFDLLLGEVYKRLHPGGNLVVNVATIEGLYSAYQTLKTLAAPVRVWNVSIARGIEQMDTLRFDAIAPTFLLAVTKQAQTGR
ncbi:precorrin-6y C5,15-methyltransferase (decarboxylating) subunit CbiE [Paludisphaera borealis]|uniref:Cobalamin biosynthesis bifunctional protein CbiET n=1 Tax=Paludisphaera borealis TaxID=1387353 RepID=A0A1U7CN75_9BACT|nr:precorrin-6y C5,15-methyltransferase (decarboxylating) subunit CbiE [Paludisphaera borealis]APW60371.1 Cobalamin biosynthesis bifunctional protein CbiET [Paludisphaera borealis]